MTRHGKHCAVAFCRNHDKNGMHLSFFRFPKDARVREKWIVMCKREDSFNADTARICSDHFTPDNFKRDLRAELMGTKHRKMLLSCAIPSVRIELTEQTESISKIGLGPSFRPRKRIKCVTTDDNCLTEPAHSPNNVLYSSNPDESNNIEGAVVPEGIASEFPQEPYNVTIFDSEIIINDTEIPHCEQNESCIDKPNYKDLFTRLLFKHKECLHDLENVKKEVHSTKSSLRTLIKQKDQDIKNKSLEILRKYLTDNQIKLLTQKKKFVHWSSHEFEMALSLRHLSKRTYFYLTKELRYPLPGLKTLKKWVSNFPIEQGILSNVIKLMAISMKKIERGKSSTVILFDEMKVKRAFEYDVKQDIVVGPYSSMQVVMAQSLSGEWIQPVYIDFDRKMTMVLLRSLIEQLESSGCLVVAFVAKCGIIESELGMELELSKEKTYFTLDERGKKIYFFPDPLDLLYEIRNVFLEGGFIAEDGSTISKEPIVNLIDSIDLSEYNDLTLYHNLTEHHVNKYLQNETLAKQLFSCKTANSLFQFKNHLFIEPSVVEMTALFIKTISRWFYLMNTGVCDLLEFPANGESELDELLHNLDEILPHVVTLIKSVFPMGLGSTQLFQNGVLLSIRSLQHLLKDMKQKYSTQYIKSCRISLNSLEQLFSKLQGINEKELTPVDCLYQMRRIILEQVNKDEREGWTKSSERYLIADLFKACGVAVNPEKSPPSDTGILINGFVKGEISMDQEMSEKGLLYLTGWIAKKYMHNFPNLRKVEDSRDHSYALHSSDGHPNRSSFVEPSDYFLSKIRQMEELFTKLCKSDLPKTRGIVKETFLKIAEAMEGLNRKIILTYVKQRILIRIDFLNRVLCSQNTLEQPTVYYIDNEGHLWQEGPKVEIVFQ